MPLKKLIPICVISFLSAVTCRDHVSINMLMSFLTHEQADKQTNLFAPSLRWDAYHRNVLAKKLFAEGIGLARSFQPNRTERFLQNNVVFVDLNSVGAYDLMMEANKKDYFKSPYRWLILESRDTEMNMQVLNNINILIDSEVVLASKVSESEYVFTEETPPTNTLVTNFMSKFLVCLPITGIHNICNPPQSDGGLNVDILYEHRCQIHTYHFLHSDAEDNSYILEALAGRICFYWFCRSKKFTHQVCPLFKAYKISATSDVIKLPRGLWRAPNSGWHKTNENATALVIKEEEKETKTGLKIELEVKQMKVTKYGIFEDHRESKVLSSRRHNLQRHVLTVANVVTDSNETRQHMDDRLDLHHDSIAKMSYMVVKICFEMLNATERRVFTHTWGYRDQYGNWQGLVKMLLNNEADLGTLTIFTKDRMENIDYIAMVGSTAVRFVFREPPLAYVSNIFALPFTGAVWLAILICVLGCSVFLYITSKWEATMGMHPLQLDGSWADVLILIIGAVLQQGCNLEPRQAAGRCVTVLLFIALTILYAAYSANIVVLLRAPSSSVRTLSDLLNSPLKLGASDFEYNRYFFKKLNEPIRKTIYDKKIAPKGKKPNFYSMKDGIEKIRQGLFAFHMELNPGYRLIQDTYREDEKCDLVEIDYINEIDPWLPGQRRAPHRDLFKINFLKIRESGIQSCIHRRLHVPRPRCSGTVSTFSSVGIPDIYPALLITLYGFLVAPVTLLLEVVCKRLLKIKQKIPPARNIDFIN